MEVLDIGSECEKRFSGVRERAIEELIADSYSKSDYREQVREVRSIPVEERPAWRKSAAFELHQENIEFARREMQGMDPDDENEAVRFIRYYAPRPYGVKAQIVQDVAAWATAKRGRVISRRTVQRCWDSYRKFLATLRDDE